MLNLGSNILFSSLENGRRVPLIVKCGIFTGTVAKTKQPINISVKNEKMSTSPLCLSQWPSHLFLSSDGACHPLIKLPVCITLSQQTYVRASLPHLSILK